MNAEAVRAATQALHAVQSLQASLSALVGALQAQTVTTLDLLPIEPINPEAVREIAADPAPTWSDARRDAIRMHWRMPIADLAIIVNALPGPELTRTNIAAYGLSVLKLPKRGSFVQVQSPPPAPTPASAPRPVAPPASHAPVTTSQPAQPSGWSDARIQVLKQDFPAGLDVSSIVESVNRFPGRPLSSRDVLARAAALGLERPMKPQTGPIEADFGTIRAWAGQRGIQFNSAEDLGRVNRKCVELGVRQFVLSRGR